jgi:hypothetical protein
MLIALYADLLSAAGVQKIVMMEGVTNLSQWVMMIVVLIKGKNFWTASVRYVSAKSSRNSDWENLQETEGKSEKVCTSSHQPGAASTTEVCSGVATSLLNPLKQFFLLLTCRTTVVMET